MIPVENIFKLVVFIIFCTAAAIELFYWLWYYTAPLFHKPGEPEKNYPAVSVIICARNEAANIRKFLPLVLEQDYPSYEVILVNDCSEDGSDDILGEFIVRYKHLKISSITKDPQFTHNKKFAQFIGIKAAKNEILVFTDADCLPQSDKWLKTMAQGFDEKTEIVLGYGGYMREKGLLNSYIRYDCTFIAMQYLGMALKKVPYMGVGRNLAYRRSVFFRNKGFGEHNHIISGDDDLFINAVATKQNTKVEFRPESHTRSVPAASFSEFLSQKERHFTTARYYKPLHKILLFLEPFIRLIFYGAFLYLMIILFLWPYLAGLFLIRLIVQGIIFSSIQKRLNERGLLFYSLIFDIFSPLLNGLIYMLQMSNRAVRNTWK